jgi:hypothetical protein
VQPVLAIDTNAKNATIQMTTTLENGDTQLQFNYAENVKNQISGSARQCLIEQNYKDHVLIFPYLILSK